MSFLGHVYSVHVCGYTGHKYARTVYMYVHTAVFILLRRRSQE